MFGLSLSVPSTPQLRSQTGVCVDPLDRIGYAGADVGPNLCILRDCNSRRHASEGVLVTKKRPRLKLSGAVSGVFRCLEPQREAGFDAVAIEALRDGRIVADLEVDRTTGHHYAAR